MADKSVTYTILDAKYDDFLTGFLKGKPNVETNKETGELEFTDNQWVKECGKRFFKRFYRIGKNKIADEANTPNIDDEVIA